MSTLLKPLNDLTEIKTNGFFKTVSSANVIKIKPNIVIDQYFNPCRDDQDYEQELINAIAQEIFVKKLAIITQREEMFGGNNKKIISAELNISEPGNRFVSVENDSFIVDGQKFSEEDIIFAIRNSYPERFI